MPGPASPAILPQFIDSDGHRLFACLARPAASADRHLGVLLCPAFAEEMNRARRTTRLLCTRAAALGLTAASIDLYGTGDSSGEFGDARWERWLAELAAGVAWLERQGCASIWLLGARAGALLAWEVSRLANTPMAGIVLWQPVVTGAAVVTDLLRMRIAAGHEPRESLALLRAELAAGRPVEAGGYRLAPALAGALEAVTLAGPATPPGPVCWIEIVADPGTPLRRPAEATIAALRTAGADVTLLQVNDPPFWSTAEVTVGQATVEATITWLASRS